MTSHGKQFSLNLSRLLLKAQAKANAIVRKIVLDVGARVVMLSPVGNPELWKSAAPKGYVGGRFRANWQYGETAVPIGVLAEIDPRGSRTIERLRAAVRRDANGKVHFLTNNLPYAMRLETGWSSQAPAGMVAITVREFQTIVDRVATELRGE